MRSSWIASELKLVQNAQPAVAKFGGDLGTVIAGIDMWMRTLKIGLPITTETVSHLQFIIFGAMICFLLIKEPLGFARLWQIGKEKLRLWPFPH